MKLRIYLIIIILITITIFNSSNKLPDEMWVIAAPYAIMYEKPAIEKNIITNISYGEKVEIVFKLDYESEFKGMIANWFKVSYDGKIGWIFGTYLSKNKNAEKVDINKKIPLDEQYKEVWVSRASGGYIKDKLGPDYKERYWVPYRTKFFLINYERFSAKIKDKDGKEWWILKENLSDKKQDKKLDDINIFIGEWKEIIQITHWEEEQYYIFKSNNKLIIKNAPDIFYGVWQYDFETNCLYIEYDDNREFQGEKKSRKISKKYFIDEITEEYIIYEEEDAPNDEKFTIYNTKSL